MRPEVPSRQKLHAGQAVSVAIVTVREPLGVPDAFVRDWRNRGGGQIRREHEHPPVVGRVSLGGGRRPGEAGTRSATAKDRPLPGDARRPGKLGGRDGHRAGHRSSRMRPL
jgi:hypothetical protein